MGDYLFQINLDLTCSTEMDAGVPNEDGMNASAITVSSKAIIKAKLFSMNTKPIVSKFVEI